MQVINNISKLALSIGLLKGKHKINGDKIEKNFKSKWMRNENESAILLINYRLKILDLRW